MEFSFNALIVDSDEKLQEFLHQSSDKTKNLSVRYVFAMNAKEVTEILSREETVIHWVFINPVSYGLSSLRIVSSIHKHRPVTPIYFFHENKPPFPLADMPKLAVQSVIQKHLLGNLVSILATKTLEKIPEKYLKDASIVSRGVIQTSTQGEFFHVPACDLLSGLGVFLDLYIQDDGNQFTKVIDPKDNFTFDQVRIYLDKGIRQFFIKKQTQNRLLTYCDMLAKNLLTRTDVSDEVRIVEIFNFGQSVIDKVRETGLNSDYIDLACQYGRYLRTIMPKLKDNHESLLDKFLHNIQAYDHAVSVTVVAMLISSALKMDSEVVQQSISIAGFFQNLGLYTLPEEVQNAEERIMSENQKKLYVTHPLISANLLEKLGTLDETVVQAVAQHHERRDHSGFPNKLGGSKINRIAEIIGISDEFIQILKDKHREPSLSIGQKLNQRVFPKFSFQVVEAFKIAFKSY